MGQYFQQEVRQLIKYFMKLRFNNRLVMGLMLAVVLYGCKESVGTIDFVTPPSENGQRVLTINVTSNTGTTLTGYDVNITGPTTASATNVSGSYQLTNLGSGVYSIRVSLNGYIERVTQVNVQLPAEDVDYLSATTVILTQRAPTQPVNNTTGGTVQTGSSSAAQSTITATIPPNAFPASALDSNGNVNFGVTRARASDDISDIFPGAVPTEIFWFEPRGVTLLEPIQVSIEMDLPQSVIDSGLPISFLGEDGSVIFGTITGVSSEISFKGPGVPEIMRSGFVSAPLQILQSMTPQPICPNKASYDSIQSCLDTTENGYSSYTTVATFSCGAGGNATYSIPRQNPSEEVIANFSFGTNIDLVAYVNRAQFSESKTVTAIPGTRASVRARHATEIYRFVDGLVYTLNQDTIEFVIERSNCHNSGGS